MEGQIYNPNPPLPELGNTGDKHIVMQVYDGDDAIIESAFSGQKSTIEYLSSYAAVIDFRKITIFNEE